MRLVIRSADGAIINIGPWDHQIEPLYEERFDEDGEPTLVLIGEATRNPLPEGAYEDEAEIVEGWDGGLYAADDPNRLHPTER